MKKIFENTNAGLDIEFLAAEFPSQSGIENYQTNRQTNKLFWWLYFIISQRLENYVTRGQYWLSYNIA